MKICFPVSGNNSLESPMYNHFGSAPGFIVADTITGTVCDEINRDQDHAHGACNPVRALGGQDVEAIMS